MNPTETTPSSPEISTPAPRIDRLALKPVTPKEREIIRLIAGGLRNKAVATEASIAQNTVKVHLRRIFKKLGVSTRADAVAVATQRGLVG